MAQHLYTSFEQVGTKRNTNDGGVRPRYILDDRGRQLLLSLYDGTTEKIDELERLLGVPRWKITHWAADLGLAAQRPPHWTVEDEEYLERNLHKKSVAEIANKLGRTKVSIRLKAKRLGVNKAAQEGYTMRGLGIALGCDSKKIRHWVELGWLHGKRRKTERSEIQGGDIWLFTNSDVRNLVVKHPGEIDPRRVDWIWMVDILTGNHYGLGSLDSVRGE